MATYTDAQLENLLTHIGARSLASLQAENLCREFAEEFPTVNVISAITMAEQGMFTWEALAGLFERSLRAAIADVSATLAGRYAA